MFSERMLTYSLTIGALAIMANSAPDQYYLLKQSKYEIIFGYMAGIGLCHLLKPSLNYRQFYLYLIIEGFLLSQSFMLSIQTQLLDATELKKEWDTLKQTGLILYETFKNLLTIQFLLSLIYF